MSPIQSLSQLQELDSRLDEINKRVEQIRALLGEDESVRQAENTLAELNEQVRDWKAKQTELEQERASLLAETKASEDRLYSGKISNPRELTDLQNKILELKERHGALEEPTLEALMMVEEITEDIAKAEQVLEEAKQKLAEASGELLAEQDVLQSEKGEKQKQQSSVREKIDHDTLQLYDMLRKRPGGVAVVGMRGEECGGCGVEITSQLLQKVKMGQVIPCPTCGRIMVRGSVSLSK